MPELDGTVEAARKLQAVQANMYMKAKLAPDQLRDGWAHSRADASNYQDALRIMEALKERHGADIDFQRDQLRGHCAKGGRLPGQGRPQGGAQAVPSCSLQTHHHPQEPRLPRTTTVLTADSTAR